MTKYILPFCGLSFYFVFDFLCYTKTFYFSVVPIVYFFSFVSLAMGDTSNKILLQAMSEILLPVFSSMIFYGFGSNPEVCDSFLFFSGVG